CRPGADAPSVSKSTSLFELRDSRVEFRSNPKPLALLRPASAATLPRQTVVDPSHGPKTSHSFGTVVNTLSRSEYFTRPAIGRATARRQRIVIVNDSASIRTH